MFIFEYGHYVLSQLGYSMEQESYLMLVQIMCQVESQTILKFWKIEISCVWLESHTNHNLNQIQQGKIG